MRFPLIAAVLLTVFFNVSASRAAGPMIVSGNPDGPPISWGKNGTLAGAAPELAAKILSELNIPFTIINAGSWQEVQDKAREGKVDMIVSAYTNDERRTYMKFSKPYLDSPVVIVVRKGNGFALTSWDVLIGKKGVAHTGESFGEKFDTFIKEKLDVDYLPYERAFQELANDTADYLIIDLYPAVIYSKLLEAEKKIDILDTPATVQQFHMALSKKSPYLNLLPEIDKKITELKKEGYMKKLAVQQYKKWHETFLERQRFFARQKARAGMEQNEYNAAARDRGLEALGRFVERNYPYMDGTDLP